MTVFTLGARRARTAILLLTAALVLAACGRGPDERFAAEPAARADVVERVSAPGSVQPNAAADVTAPSAGTLNSLVHDGARVRKGQVVARISSPEVDDAVRQAEAAAGAASSLGGVPSLPTGQTLAAFEQVQDQVSESTRTVLDALRAAVPQLPAADRKAARKKLDQAERRIEKAQEASAAAAREAAGAVQSTGAALSGALASASAAQQAQADAALDAARAQQERLTLKAPIAGTVQLGRSGGGGSGGGVSLPSIPGLPSAAGEALQGLAGGGGGGGTAGSGPLLRTGAQVSAGATILTILDVGRLAVAAEVDETDIALVKHGQKAEVELDAFPGVPFGAEVLRVALAPEQGASSGAAEGSGVSYRVDLFLGAPAADAQTDVRPSPRVGMTATADIEVRSADDALSVPSSALVGRGSGSAVYVVEDDRVQLRQVRLAASGEDRVAIRSGVREGERVVTRGAERLRDGQEYPGP